MAKIVAIHDARIYQIKITLREVRPPLWRRVLVPGNFSLGKLHKVIQAAMGWYGVHLHQFVIGEDCYGVPHPDYRHPMIDQRRYTLQQVAGREKARFIYEYDFGDGWEHDILVEKILAPEEGVRYPVCVKGKRACPPEDVGGPWGYAHFLEAMRDPKHEEHESFIEWIGREFDPEAFDLDDANYEMKKIR